MFGLDFELVQVNLFSGLDPLFQGTKTASGNGEFHNATCRWIDQVFLLEIRLERASCCTLRVTDIVASDGSFAGNCASICHRVYYCWLEG